MRRASEAPFPYGWPGIVCYFMVDADGPRQIVGRDALRAAAREALADGPPIYATWPGRYSTDLFVIDEPGQLAQAIKVEVKR